MITENFDNYKTGGSHKEFNIEVVGTDTVIGNTNMLQESITLDEALCSDNNLKFGACEASQFSVQVANIFEDFVGKELIVSVTMDGVTTKYGTFKVDSDKPTADRVWRVLTCYDKMKDIINANVLEWYKGLTFPMSQKAYRDSFFTYLGIEQVEVSLINDDFMVQGGFTATDTLSGKTIITSICEFNGVFGHINRDGKFDYVSLNGASTVECPPYENNSVTYEDYDTDYITRVTMRGTASDVGTSVGTEGNEYIITNNPIIYGTEGTDELITALTRLLNKIGSISYRPYSVGKTIGNPCVELGDAIIVNTRHQTINSYVIKRTLTGIQALRDKYSATGSKVYPVEVNSIQEELSRTQGKMNMITRTVDETKSQIIAIQTELADNYLTSTQTQTLISQSASQIQAIVTQTITAELPDMIDEQTEDLSNQVIEVESKYTQLSNEIVMKVKADGTVAEVALGASAEGGSDVLIKGDNIQLDGDVTIGSDFKVTATNINVSNLSAISANLGTITAGIIRSSNYVANTKGIEINFTSGTINSKNLRMDSTGNVATTNMYANNIIFQNSLLYNFNNANYYFVKLDTYDTALLSFDIYNAQGNKAISLKNESAVIASNWLYGSWRINESLSVNGYGSNRGIMITQSSDTPYLTLTTDDEGGQIQLYGKSTSNSWLIDSYDDASLRFYCSTGQSVRFTNDGYIYFRNNGRNAIGSYSTANQGTFSRVNDIIKIRASNYGLLSGEQGNFSFTIASWSDSALKKNIKDSKINALDLLNQIHMYEFDYIDSKYGQHEDIGYLANELKDIIPDAVVAVPILEEDRKQFGKDTLYQVNDSAIIKYLVKSVQELSKKINILENK